MNQNEFSKGVIVISDWKDRFVIRKLKYPDFKIAYRNCFIDRYEEVKEPEANVYALLLFYREDASNVERYDSFVLIKALMKDVAYVGSPFRIFETEGDAKLRAITDYMEAYIRDGKNLSEISPRLAKLSLNRALT